jgi:tetratricopeptide (TPR) repeat protein
VGRGLDRGPSAGGAAGCHRGPTEERDSGDAGPQTLADAIARRLQRLDSKAHDPLLAIAALSNPTLAVMQAVLPDFTLSDLESAERETVIAISGDRVRFTHPLLASTHYCADRRELHRRLAEVVTDTEERAHHLALGAEAPDRGTALAIEQAAQEAAQRGAPEAAAELLEQAARLTPDSAAEARRSRIVAAAEQQKAAGDLSRARTLLEDVVTELPRGPVRARALTQLAQLRTDDLAAAVALLNEALADVGDHERVGAQAEARLAEVWASLGDHRAAVEHG